MKNIDKKPIILKLLSEKGEMSKSEIFSTLGINAYYGDKYLKELEKEGKIKNQKINAYTYYSIKSTGERDAKI